MRARAEPGGKGRGLSAASASAVRAIGGAFDQFRDVSAEFTASLRQLADFRAGPNGIGPAQLNVQVARSLFGKWTLDLLVLLMAEGELGFASLRKALRGVSSRILSSKLKWLESQGLVRRRVVDSRPPHVNYGLTERGLTVMRLGEPVVLYLRFLQGLYGSPSVAPVLRRAPSSPLQPSVTTAPA